MATVAFPSSVSASPKLFASPWHTALLVALFLSLALGGAFFQRRVHTQPGMLQQHPSVIPLYLSLIAMEWGLFIYVWRAGLQRSGTSVSEIIGGRWTSAKNVVVDAGLAFGLWSFWALFMMLWNHWSWPDRGAVIQPLLPQRALEVLLWVGVSISAGFCEEFVFRGYFLKQFAAFTRVTWIALLLQSILFGISHGYQGIEACVKISIYGALFGLLALWRKSLRPGIIAHAWSDVLSGIFGI